jgi:serine acetyltransferase
MNTKLGDKVYANTNLTIHDHTFVVIGSNVKIGPGVGLLTGGHPVDTQERAEGSCTAKPIVIGDDVWIGANVRVLGGVRIGNGAILAAGALANRDVAPSMTVGGIPTKLFAQSVRWWVGEIEMETSRVIFQIQTTDTWIGQETALGFALPCNALHFVAPSTFLLLLPVLAI